MNKFLKIALSSIIALPLLTLAALVLFIQFQDANVYKQNIEEQAKKQAGLNLSIKGSLAWSIFPLGIDINEISIDDQNGDAFASVKRILAQVDLFSLFRASPSIHTLLLDSVNLKLLEEQQGVANWQNILPQDKPSDLPNTETNAKKNDTELTTQQESKKSELSFLLSKLEITNLTLDYESKPKNQKINISPLHLEISDIAPDKDFPILLSFEFKDSIQQTFVSTELTGRVNFSPDFTEIKVKELSSKFEASGEFSKSRKLHAQINSQLSINTKEQEISIPELSILFEELKLKSRLDIRNYSSDPQVEGDVHLQSFNPKELAEKIQLQLPELSAPNSLEKLEVKSLVTMKSDQIQLSQIEVFLDESRWLGDINVHTTSQALMLDLTGDTLNIDNYLPKVPGSNNVEQTSKSKKEQSSDKQASELLPLEKIRQLNLDIHLKQKSLTAKNVLIENIDIRAHAENGLITLENLSATSHEGSFTTVAKLDARSNTPSWDAESKISDLNLTTLIQALEIQNPEETATISGQLNFKTTLSAKGNQTNDLLTSASNISQFDIVNGSLNGINLKALNCQGIAFINQDSLDTTNWPKETPFDTITGQATLSDEILNTRFDVVSSGLSIDATGPLNLSEQTLDFRLAMNITGDIENHTACRVNEKFKDLPIPVRCKGTFSTPPGKLCKLDSVRLREAAKKLAVKEGKRKLEKELNRSLNKHLGDKDEIKDAAKDLLKKLF